MKQEYRQCSMSVMDTIADPDIRFDTNGICNYYQEYKKGENELVLSGKKGELKIEQTVETIKSAGKGKAYDCIMGLSGGVDSSYVAYLAKQYGLRPLAVHLDNSWNSELAVKNIEQIVNRLGFDLHTHVVNWDEFKDLQLSYIKASVIDIEAITDHAISATIAKLAKKHGVKYMLTGNNVVTEYVMPPSWIFNKNDHVNLLDIHARFGSLPLKTFPVYDTYLKNYIKYVLKAQAVGLLNWLPYNKAEVKKKITNELGWRDYGGKHYESIFTKFYQAYILPTKFKVDKRKSHLSNLIFSQQIGKEAALLELEKPLYPEDEFKNDYEFVLKKFDLTGDQFQQYMKEPVRKHTDFAVEKPLREKYAAVRLISPLTKLIRSREK